MLCCVLCHFALCQVVLCTAQFLLNTLVHGLVPLDRRTLFVFHDCHKAVNKHPFALIVANYIRPYTCVFHDKEPPSSVNGTPAIFGTTRLPIIHSQRRQDIVELSIRAVQLNLNARMYSERDLCTTTGTTSTADVQTTSTATTTTTTKTTTTTTTITLTNNTNKTTVILHVSI